MKEPLAGWSVMPKKSGSGVPTLVGSRKRLTQAAGSGCPAFSHLPMYHWYSRTVRLLRCSCTGVSSLR